MVAEFVYANPPLAEVIAEVLWETIPLSVVPGAALDPYFPQVSSAFEANLRAEGFGFTEFLAPPTMPLELLAGQVVKRFRTGRDSYPIFQIGPGVATCNGASPYAGWDAFSKTILLGMNSLVAAWPSAAAGPALKTIRLRYIDAFDHSFGYLQDVEFLSHLRVGSGVNAEVLEAFCQRADDVAVAVSTRFPLKHLPGATITLSANRGQKDEKSAFLLDCIVERAEVGAFAAVDVINWFDSAHQQISDIFHAVVTPELESRFGAKKYLGTK